MTTAEKIANMYNMNAKAEAGGGPAAIEKQHALGKLTARERVAALLDEGSFTELDKFVSHHCTNFDMAGKEAPAEGVITGYGTIGGRLVYLYAQDFTVLGGSLGEMHAAKICKVMELGAKTGAPVIGISDSGGARIQEAVNALSGYGKIFFANTRASGVIPQLSLVLGPSAGGAVYSPALTDFTFMVKGISKMFITGPEVVKTVTGQDVSPEELGGAMTHNRTSGVAHFAADSEAECFEQVRRLLSFLPGSNREQPPVYQCTDDLFRQDEALDVIIPDSPNQAYDMKAVIAHIVDNGDFLEVHQHFANNIITAFARLGGQSVGIIANQPRIMAGCIDIDASDKAARFIRFCDAFNVPILNLVDVPGFLPGANQETGGIIRHGAKMLYAYSEATVPKITMVTRKAYGGAYIAMCSKELGADQVLAWPTAEIAVMGAEGAANIIFRKQIAEAGDNQQAVRQELIDQYKARFATPYMAAESGFVDQIILPHESRPKLINALRMLNGKKQDGPKRKHGNFPV